MNILVQAQDMLEALGVKVNETTQEMAIELLGKFKNTRNVLLESNKEEYAYKKGGQLLAAMLFEEDEVDDMTLEAQKLEKRLNEIYNFLSHYAFDNDIDFDRVVADADLKKMFELSDREVCIFNNAMPHKNGKLMIAKLRLFRDGDDVVNMLKDAISECENSESNQLQINSGVRNLLH